MAKRKKKTSNGFLFVAFIFILMVIILAGYIYISKNPGVIDGIPNIPGSQPIITPAGPPTTTIYAGPSLGLLWGWGMTVT